MAEYDLLISNGTIVDGTGAPRYVGDVGVRAGRVVALGESSGSARRTIDASGLVVCPGFIDVHTHYDAQLNWDPLLSPSPWFGVTTVVIGNCGFALAPTKAADREYLLRTLQYVEGIEFASSWPALHHGNWGYETFPEYLDFLDRQRIAVNVATQIGHTALRIWVMGAEAASSRAATDAEIDEMCRILAEALDAGAAGLSTSSTTGHNGVAGRPVPSRLADEPEFLALGRTIAGSRHGRLQGTYGDRLNLEFLLRMLDETGLKITAIPPSKEPGTQAMIRDLGYEVFGQIQIIPGSLYTGLHDPSYFSINAPAALYGIPPLRSLFAPIIELETVDEKLEAYTRPGFLDQFIRETNDDKWNGSYWPALRIMRAPTRPEWEGRTVGEVARETGRPGAEVMYTMSVDSGLRARVLIPFGSQDDLFGLDLLKNQDSIRLGLHDAGAHLSQIAMACWPARLLSKYVREGGLPLERAVQHATSWSAEQFGILQRGMLVPGYAADIVVFDADTIADGPVREVHDLPGGATRLLSDPVGIHYVVVNGRVVREGNADAIDDPADLPGRLLRDFAPNPIRRASSKIPESLYERVRAEAAAVPVRPS